MMFWYGGHWPFWEIGLTWVGMIAFWGLIVWAIYALVTSTTRRPGERQVDEARLILDRRLAAGEIDADEYRRLRDLIDHRTQLPASEARP
ncbi:MAG: SHOCT domain-containing protein [Acidimicrobiales bacterium]